MHNETNEGDPDLQESEEPSDRSAHFGHAIQGSHEPRFHKIAMLVDWREIP